MKPRSTKNRRFYLEPEKIMLIKQILLGVFLFSLISLILAGIWYGTRLPTLTISQITVVDGQTIEAETVRQETEKVLSGDYWHFIPKKFSWFYPDEDLLNAVSNIERIKDVKIEKVSNTELNITFSEYLPYALWCNENNENCYFLDEDGFAFGKAPELTGGSLMRYHKLGEEPQLRTSFISTKDFDKTKEFEDLLVTTGWYINEIEVDTVRDVFYSLSDGSEIRATLEEDSAKAFNYLKTLRQSKEFEHLKPGNFHYVDLRFGDKLYVNEKLATATSTKEEGGIATVASTEAVATNNENSAVATLSAPVEISSSTENAVLKASTTLSN
jgi:cell division septal protein FtsQ